MTACPQVDGNLDMVSHSSFQPPSSLYLPNYQSLSTQHFLTTQGELIGAATSAIPIPNPPDSIATMHYSQFLPFVTLFASVVVEASPTAMLEGRSVGLVARAPDTPGDACIRTPLSAEPDYSYYTFHINADIGERAKNAGLIKIGVQQHCDSNGGLFGSSSPTPRSLTSCIEPTDSNSRAVWATNTNNWAYVLLDKFGPENPYKVKVDRCQKGNDRHISTYRVWLCNENNWCGTTACGLDRKVCPEKKTKAVDLSDNLIWPCAL